MAYTTITLFKYIMSFFQYSGMFILIDQEFNNGLIKDILAFDDVTAKVLMICAVTMWVLRMVWFVYSKFYLERRERLIAMKKSEDKIKENEDV